MNRGFLPLGSTSSYTHNTFVMETLIDELATRAKIDPIAYRLKLFEPNATTIRAALAPLEEKSAAWRRGLAPGHAVGIACNDRPSNGRRLCRGRLD